MEKDKTGGCTVCIKLCWLFLQCKSFNFCSSKRSVRGADFPHVTGNNSYQCKFFLIQIQGVIHNFLKQCLIHGTLDQCKIYRRIFLNCIFRKMNELIKAFLFCYNVFIAKRRNVENIWSLQGYQDRRGRDSKKDLNFVDSTQFKLILLQRNTIFLWINITSNGQVYKWINLY